jgi:hypothetical protein
VEKARQAGAPEGEKPRPIGWKTLRLKRCKFERAYGANNERGARNQREVKGRPMSGESLRG